MKHGGRVQNCWEYMKCGREPGGSRADELGVCPVTTAEKYDGVNRGKNAGRFCWFVAGTFCDGEVQGTWARKFGSCLECPFFRLVEREEDRFFVLTDEDLPPSG